ncbi:unnamed protein product [Darwinula stevensoni]|uniref:Thioredoxin domain-containing protein n=1 Tax=Darwinula stevensoni TaxID=69355 RepID=A0A7R9A5C5_9CRUS|nr:unnamed protein product [Darwinula stevensoni]CAG0886167.1 unnamed protein product [Darwinula stevensoni]
MGSKVVTSCAIFVASFIFTVVSGQESAVLYDAETFHKEVSTNPHFVMFFAPWCGHCKRLSPTWEDLATKYKDDASIKIARVDCTVETALCAQHEVTGYPTLKFLNGKADDAGVKYRGPRDLASLETWLKEQLDGGTPAEEPSEKKEEEKKAEQPQVPEAEKQVVNELTIDTFKSFVEKGSHFVKFYAPWCGHCKRLAPTWDELGKVLEYDQSVQISKIDCTAHKPLCQEHEVKGYPTLLWIEDGKVVEKYSGQRTLEALKEYVDKQKGGSMEEGKSSTEEGATDVVPILTQETFAQVVKDGVTLIKFFAPWCGHCKRLAPTWEELGKKFIGKEGIRIAKVDCTASDSKSLCDSFEVDGFPTILLFRNGEKISEYEGNRDLSDLTSYLMKHVRDEL